MGFMDDHPKVGAAGCKLLLPDGQMELACRRSFPTPGVAFYKIVGLANLFPHNRRFGAYNLTHLDPNQEHEVDALSGSFMMVRHDTLEQVGSWDERYFMYGEDLDLATGSNALAGRYGTYLLPKSSTFTANPRDRHRAFTTGLRSTKRCTSLCASTWAHTSSSRSGC